jgi:hypothetical protein
MNKEQFKQYISKQGYTPVLVWSNPTGLFARLENHDHSTITNQGFTEVITKEMYHPIVMLSSKDALNINHHDLLEDMDDIGFDDVDFIDVGMENEIEYSDE